MIAAEDALAPIAIANYIMPKVIFRVSQDISLEQVKELYTVIKERSPAGINFPQAENEIIWFNPNNGMELPLGQPRPQKAIPVSCLEDKLNRLSSIKQGIDHLLNCLKDDFNDNNVNCFNNCQTEIKLKFQETKNHLTALSPIDNANTLEQASKLISQFSHFCNVSLRPVLATPPINFFAYSKSSEDRFKKTQKLINAAEIFSLVSKPREVVYTVSKSGTDNFKVAIAIPEPSYFAINDKGITFNLLESYNVEAVSSKPMQRMLIKLKTEIDDNPSELYVASSRADNMPGIRNGWQSGHLLLNSRGKEIYFSETNRLAHISSRANKKELNKEQRRINATVSLDQFIKKQIKIAIKKQPQGGNLDIYIPYTTLISPINLRSDYRLNNDKNIAIEFLRKKYKNKKITINNKTKTKTYSVNVDIFALNNPVNVARYITPTNGWLDDPKEFIRFFNAAMYDPKFKEDEILRKLLTEFDGVLNNSERNEYGEYNRELHIAALIRVISDQLGWPALGGCISGKDREALRDIYRKAIEDYIIEYRDIPRLSDAKDNPLARKRFVDIYTADYLTGHEAYLAQKNAWGARGTKTPHIYLPIDIVEAIKEKASRHILDYSEALANDNDVDKMKLPSDGKRNYLFNIKLEQYYFRFFDSAKNVSNDNCNSPERTILIKNALTDLKKYIYNELKTDKYVPKVGGSSITLDEGGENQLVPETIAEVHELLKTMCIQDRAIDYHELETLMSLADKLHERATSISITRTTITENLYLHVASQLLGLQRFITDIPASYHRRFLE